MVFYYQIIFSSTKFNNDTILYKWSLAVNGFYHQNIFHRPKMVQLCTSGSSWLISFLCWFVTNFIIDCKRSASREHAAAP